MIDIPQELDKARKGLLDLGLRNRLLNFNLDGKRTIRAFDEMPAQVFSVLVEQKKPMRFAPTKATEKGTTLFPDADSDYELNQPDEDALPTDARTRHSNLVLQTKLAGNSLQNRFLRIETEARTAIEERGVNILYLALGFVRWFESQESEQEHYAPLILVPANLFRDSAGSRFRMRWTEEDIATNESFAVKLKSDFGIILPEIPEEIEDFSPEDYFRKVHRAIRGQERWAVTNEIALGFFSFAKLLMYRDLATEAWPDCGCLDHHPVIQAILTSSPLSDPSPYGDDVHTDEIAAKRDISLVTDADSSQTIAIIDAIEGRSIAVQGPPGTGKSQTITNIIASALSMGKSVLFLAEKIAALEVVKRRLDQSGLGDSCLELHSYKARKTYVLDKIRETMEAAKPLRGDQPVVAERLKAMRARLNDFAFAMNTPLVTGGITPHKAIGLIESRRQSCRAAGPIRMPEAATWTKEQFDENRDHIHLLGRLVTLTGNPLCHPWRGVRLDALLPSDKSTLLAMTQRLSSVTLGLLSQFKSICQGLGIQLACNAIDRSYLGKLLEICVLKPSSDVKGADHRIWNDKIEDIMQLVSVGNERLAIVKSLADRVKLEVLSTDFQAELRAYEFYSNSRLKYFYAEFRRARKALKNAVLPGQFPKASTEGIALLRQLCHCQVLTRQIAALNDVGRSAFAGEWHGTGSDWAALKAFSEWMRRFLGTLKERAIEPSLFSQIVSCTSAELKSQCASLREHEAEFQIALGEWYAFLCYDFNESFALQADALNLDCLIAKLELGLGRLESVYEWVNYRRERETCRNLGIQTFTELSDNGTVSPDNLVAEFEMAYGDAVLRKAMSERGALREFSGENHAQLVEIFKTLDKRLIEVTRQYLAALLWERMPHPTLGDPTASAMNYLTNQLHRKRGIAPVRELISRVGELILKIKPCFMMSPMSVAQFLPPGSIAFDLLIIDEASQMRPSDALGAVGRCGQCIIVGDTKQLPPTDFFDKMIAGDPDDDINLTDVESILDAAISPFGGARTLRWHYRSRHESLIAYSNKAFYENKLRVFPSPVPQSSELGVIDHFVANGVYARGGSRKNLNEAAAVAEAILGHAEHCPGQSLGVVALSRAQQEAIQDKLEELRREHSEYESFFSETGPEPFFIKNLETVQGDERDVIFISIGYGKDENGFPHMNFGPVNRDGGWRRLNVLITRARMRCEVFHSLRADEIRIDALPESERPSIKGRLALRNYLGYVESGRLDQPVPPSNGESESEFEESVARELEMAGLIIQKQVGVANFRIDLAVIDPDKPGRYLLGIECDGATYHSARSARDRDRLRQEVLESLGWKIYRIWSLDWIKDKDKEMHRLILAIEAAKGSSPAGGSGCFGNGASGIKENGTVISRGTKTKTAKPPHELVPSIPYKKASISRRRPWDPNCANIGPIASVVTEIVAQESPIHREELSQRVLEVYGFGRLGGRISGVISRALTLANHQGGIVQKRSFIWRAGMTAPPIRNRSGMSMDIRMVPGDEIRRAEIELKEIAEDINGDYLVREISLCLGYERFTSRMGKYIKKHLNSSLT